MIKSLLTFFHRFRSSLAHASTQPVGGVKKILVMNKLQHAGLRKVVSLNLQGFDNQHVSDLTIISFLHDRLRFRILCSSRSWLLCFQMCQWDFYNFCLGISFGFLSPSEKCVFQWFWVIVGTALAEFSVYFFSQSATINHVRQWHGLFAAISNLSQLTRGFLNSSFLRCSFVIASVILLKFL